MTTATEANTYGAERTVVPLGGFNTTLLRLEFRRLTRNRRTMIFTLVMPVVFFLVFGLGQGDDDHGIGHGNVAAYIMISMALYGAMLATTSGGAMVSIERASGWSRQLRLTPLTPVAYIAVKLIMAMLLGLVSILVVYVVGAFTSAQMDGSLWFTTALIAWLGSSIFAAFGLFMGTYSPVRTSCSCSDRDWLCSHSAADSSYHSPTVPYGRPSHSSPRCSASTPSPTHR